MTVCIDRLRDSRAVLYLVFLLSGVAGLGYEIVWTRMFSVGLGHEVPSMLAVVAAFFGGLAIGGWGLDGVVSRSRMPGRWYAAMELIIGAWAVGTIFAIPWANDRVADLTGLAPSPVRHWMVAFLVPLITLLPATVAMGVTLPAMDRFVSRLRQSGRNVGRLYALNTLGAVAGTLASTFLLIPSFGYRRTILMLAGLNVLCAAYVLAGPARDERQRPKVQANLADLPPRRRLYATVFLTGLLGIGYEILVVRVMGQVLENTVYSFASALSVYLLATALGAAAYQAFAPRQGFRLLLTYLLQSIAIAGIIGTLVLWHSGEIYEYVWLHWGKTFFTAVAGEMLLALLVFFLPAFLMGATFSHLAQAARQEQGGVGRALGVNTLGGALAPLLFGVILLPAVGAQTALLIVSFAYLLLIPQWRPKHFLPAAAALLLVPLLPPNLRLVKPKQGGEIVAYREGVMAAVAVTTDAEKYLYLKVNNRFQMGGTLGIYAQRRQAHIPLLLHPDPRRALFLGLGAGITFGAAADHPELWADGVELIPEVVDLMSYFTGSDDLRNPKSQPRLTVHVADARRFIRACDAQYDVIIADLFHPARDGSGSLYTREHFQAIRDRLAPGGLFCQWLPLYQMNEQTLRVIVRTYLDVFPHNTAYMENFLYALPSLGLVGSVEPLTFPPNWFSTRIRDPKLSKELADLLLTNGYQLFGCLVAGREDLVAFARSGPLNTDDRPIVTFEAPHFTYGKRVPPYTNIKLLIESCRPRASQVIVDDDGAPALLDESRLDDFLAARDLFLKGLFLQLAGNENAATTAIQDSLNKSPEFREGYNLAMRFAEQRSRTRPMGGR